MRLCRLAAALLAVAYPALVYYGLTRFEPRVLGLLLLAILLLRQGSRTLAFWCSAPRGERTLILAMLALSLAIVGSNREELLRLYPAAMSGGMFLLFARSLRHPPSFIERIARLHEPELDAAGDLAGHFSDILSVDGILIGFALDNEWLFQRRFVLLSVDEIDLAHTPQHILLTQAGAFRIDYRIERRRSFRQACKHCSFGNGDVRQRFAEVNERCCAKTIGTLSEVNLVDIQLENLILAQILFDLESK